MSLIGGWKVCESGMYTAPKTFTFLVLLFGSWNTLLGHYEIEATSQTQAVGRAFNWYADDTLGKPLTEKQEVKSFQVHKKADVS